MIFYNSCPTAAILSLAILTYSSETSYPTYLLLFLIAATAVVPLPKKGSSTTSFSKTKEIYKPMRKFFREWSRMPYFFGTFCIHLPNTFCPFQEIVFANRINTLFPT